MLRLALALCLAAPAFAQGAAPVPTAGERVILVAGALGGGAVSVWALGPFATLGAGAATYATSAALGLDPTAGGVLLDTAAGTAVGYAAFAGTLFYFTEVEGLPADFGTSITALVAGLAVGSAAVGAVHGVRLARVRASPAAMPTPTGEPALALTVRVRL